MKTEETKQPAHTQGEWYIVGPKIQEDIKQTYFAIQTKSPKIKKGTYVMPGFYYPHSVQSAEEMEANAKRIVKCVNMHDELVSILKSLIGDKPNSDKYFPTKLGERVIELLKQDEQE